MGLKKNALSGWRVICAHQRNYASKAKKSIDEVPEEVEVKPKAKRQAKKADPAEEMYVF